MYHVVVRMADCTDAEGILAVYAPYVADTPITFECEVPSLEELRGRVRSISSFYPYLVCQVDGRIAGYAYGSKQREREAYRWNAELSVYTGQEYGGFGIGRALYGAVLELLKLQNICNAYGAVTLPNTKSEELHHSLGFEPLGVFHHTGYKLGRWHDVIWFEKCLQDAAGVPEPVKPISLVPSDDILKILETKQKMIHHAFNRGGGQI